MKLSAAVKFYLMLSLVWAMLRRLDKLWTSALMTAVDIAGKIPAQQKASVDMSDYEPRMRGQLSCLPATVTQTIARISATSKPRLPREN